MQINKTFIAILFFLVLSNTSFSQKTSYKQAAFLFTVIDTTIDEQKLNQAKALAIDISGALYITDSEKHRILKFDKNNNFSKSIGGFGWDKEQFYSPYDVSANSTLDIFIADYNNHRIQRYDKDLNYISSFYSNINQDESLQFGYPKSITTSIHGEIFILDGENNRILKINSFGEPALSFGDFGEGKGSLQKPEQIVIGQNDKIYVSDSEANKIIVYDYFGNYLFEIGTDFLNKPHGIFINFNNLLFVTDSANNRIVIFNQYGDLIFQWSKISPDLGSFKNLIDIVAFKNRVFVLDNDQVFVFELR